MILMFFINTIEHHITVHVNHIGLIPRHPMCTTTTVNGYDYMYTIMC